MRALFENENVYSIYDGRVLGHLRRHYNARMTASGVTGNADILEYPLVKYSEPIDSRLLPLSSVSADIGEWFFQENQAADVWYVSGSLSESFDGVRALYFNAVIGGQEYSYRLGLKEGVFQSYLYDLPKDFNVEADACLVARLDDGSYQKIEINYN